MEPEFPFDFIVYGTPPSLQRKGVKGKTGWKQAVKDACAPLLPEMHFATARPLGVTLYYFPDGEMEGDIDNIVKLTLDALCKYLYQDDHQIERVVVQKFEADRVFTFSSPSATLVDCALGDKPALYIRISDNVDEGL
ncbi:RusA family crossover junction endodeoxyribonuclease [Mesorhizobium sp. PL10]